MATWVISAVEQLVIANAFATPLATCVAKLFKSQIVLTPGMTVGDLTAIECDWTDYAPITLAAPSVVFPDAIRGGVSVQMPGINWSNTAPLTVPNQVWGGWLETGAGALIVAWEMAAPFPMILPNEALNLDLLFNWFGQAVNPSVYVDINAAPV